MSLKDRTPAQVAGIKFPFRNWKDITEQPFEKTTRIDLNKHRVMTERKPVKIFKTKRVRISPRPPRITPPRPSLSQVRSKR